MSQEDLKLQLNDLLSQLREYIVKTNELVDEINAISSQLQGSTLNFSNEIVQFNSTFNSIISKFNYYLYEYKLNDKKNFTKIGANNDLKIKIGFKNVNGEVHTFEAYYGTTLDKLLSTYIKTVGRDPRQCDLCFEYNRKKLSLGDYKKIEEVFKSAQEPTIIVRQSEVVNNEYSERNQGEVEE